MHSLWFTCLTSIGPALAFAFWSVGVTGCRRWLGYIYIHKTDGQPPPTTYLIPDYPPSLDDFEMQDSRWSGGKKSRAKHSCFHLLVRAIATFLFTLMGSVRAQRENKQQPLHLSADVLKYSHYCGVFMWYTGTCFLDVAELFLVPWGQSAGSSAEQELAGYSVLFKDMSAVASAGSGARWVNQFKKSLSALCSHVWETCSYLHSLICCGLSFPVRAPLYTIRNIQQMLHMHVVVWVDTLNSSLYAGKKNKWHFEILMQFVTL